MKIDDTKYDVEVSGVSLRKNFNIAVTKKAFDILSSGLYSDKIAAPIRELSTNAYDSHVEVGKKEKPFDVHLPNSLEPFFSIRDYGSGMSLEKIESLYTTYFGSDKTSSNELVGCMGLGSKSPYAYTDQFTITSWFNGKQYIYVCLKNEFGIPELNKFGEFPTTEPNGVEIKFAVNQKDFTGFLDAAQKIYKWFPVPPNIKGNSYYKQQTLPKFVFEGEGWKISTTTNYYDQQTSYAIMGNIAYPIKRGNFTTSTSHYDKDTYAALLDSGCYLYFKIGELEMTASREDLEYTPKVIAAIKARLDLIKANLGKVFSDELATQKNKWEAVLFAQKVKAKYSQHIFGILEKSQLIKFQGKSLSLGHINIPSIGKNPTTYQNITGITQYEYTTYYRKKKLTIQRELTSFIADDNIKFYLNDEPDKPEVRISNYLENNQSKHLIVLSKEIYDNKANFNTFKENVGIDDSYFSKLSDLPLPPKKARVPSGVKIDRSKIEAWRFDSTTAKNSYSWQGPSRASYWKQEMIVWNAPQIYVEINEWYWSSGSIKSKSPEYLKDILEKLTKIGVPTATIYGIKTAKIERVKKLKWVVFEDWLKDQVKKVIQVKNLKDVLKNKECLNVLQRTDLYNKGLSITNLKPGKFKQFVEKVNKIKVPDLSLVETIKEVADYCGLSAELKDPTVSAEIENFKKEENELVVHYPVLAIIDRPNYWKPDMFDKFVDCINAFECVHSQKKLGVIP